MLLVIAVIVAVIILICTLLYLGWRIIGSLRREDELRQKRDAEIQETLIDANRKIVQATRRLQYEKMQFEKEQAEFEALLRGKHT